MFENLLLSERRHTRYRLPLSIELLYPINFIKKEDITLLNISEGGFRLISKKNLPRKIIINVKRLDQIQTYILKAQRIWKINERNQIISGWSLIGKNCLSPIRNIFDGLNLSEIK